MVLQCESAWCGEDFRLASLIIVYPHKRPDVPPTLGGGSIDTSSLGTPKAYYPASSCDFNKYFTPQEIVIDITLCGDWYVPT